jgi:acetate kinase
MNAMLALNSGSSSLKFAFFTGDEGDDERLLRSGELAPIGAADGLCVVRDASGQAILKQRASLPDHHAASQTLLEMLRGHASDWPFAAVGHRLVHGGAAFSEPRRLSPALLGSLRELIPLAPDHLPQALALIEAVTDAYPTLPQAVCFDTAFHRTLPAVAQTYALPRQLTEEGRLRRYGFHGLSYESVHAALAREDAAAASGRIVIAHLGNGASLCALRAGQSIETTMGFTPIGGLVMGTRTGDLDPGALLYLMERHQLTPAQARALVSHESGLLAVSGGPDHGTPDMRALLAREADDPRAALAVALFCYRAKQYLGALAAVHGGLDTLVFTGGIGEHAPAIRARICDGLEYLGVRLDPTRNAASAPVISPDQDAVMVRVVAADEERMIARHAAAVLRGSPSQRASSSTPPRR